MTAPVHAVISRAARRQAAVATAGGLLLALGVVVSLSSGDVALPLLDVVVSLVGTGDPLTELVISVLRGPRVAAGALVGAALGLSGAALQGVLRNPLASPDLLGVTAGASVAAVGVVVTAGSAGGVSGAAAAVGLPASALAGALVASGVLYAIALRGGRLDPMRVLVVGVGITAVCTSLVGWLLTVGDVTQVGPAIAWLAGSVHVSTWPRVGALAVVLAVGAPVVLLLARSLDLMALGDEAALGLGVRVDRARAALLLTATVVAGVATAVAGAIGFVALCAPQLARSLARSDRPPLAASALLGAALLVWADLLARRGLTWTVGSPTELPVGILTAVLGAPYLLYVVARHRTTADGSRNA